MTTAPGHRRAMVGGLVRRLSTATGMAHLGLAWLELPDGGVGRQVGSDRPRARVARRAGCAAPAVARPDRPRFGWWRDHAADRRAAVGRHVDTRRGRLRGVQVADLAPDPRT